MHMQTVKRLSFSESRETHMRNRRAHWWRYGRCTYCLVVLAGACAEGPQINAGTGNQAHICHMSSTSLHHGGAAEKNRVVLRIPVITQWNTSSGTHVRYAMATVVLDIEIDNGVRLVKSEIMDESHSVGPVEWGGLVRGPGNRWRINERWIMTRFGDEGKRAAAGVLQLWVDGKAWSENWRVEPDESVPSPVIAEWNQELNEWRLLRLWYVAPWEEIAAAKRRGCDMLVSISKVSAGTVECIGVLREGRVVEAERGDPVDMDLRVFDLTLPRALAPGGDPVTVKKIAERALREVLRAMRVQ